MIIRNVLLIGLAILTSYSFIGPYNKNSQNENEIITSYPEESELKENKLLVICPGVQNGGLIYKKCLKQLQKYYPYDFQLITQDKFKDYTKDCKYTMLAKGFFIDKVTTEKDIHGNLETKTKKIFMAYYVLKNESTEDLYYGASKESLEKEAKSEHDDALKKALKRMQDHYGWK